MTFIPTQPESAQDVPYFENAKKADGWAGHTTGKSILKLKSEISEALARLGGMVTRFEGGTFDMGAKKRSGYRIFYSMEGEEGKMVNGRIDVAALPCLRTVHEEASIRMMFYMLRNALEGAWFMQQLAPGYAALMPFLLVRDGKTVTELWGQQAKLNYLLPPPSTDFIEGEVVEK